MTFFLVVTLWSETHSEPEIIELLNTDLTKWSEWVKNTGKYEGWRSQNIPPNGQLVYGLCAADAQIRENWIRSPFIRREEAISINIEISFSMRSCHGRPEKTINCEETFRLMMYEADGDGDVPSSWSDRIYSEVAVVSPNIKWTDTRANENIVTKKTFKVESKRRGIFIALKDIGACVMVQKIRVFYVACSSTTVLFADYPRMVVSYGYQIRNAKGQCVHGASLIDEQKFPQMLCQPNGNWHILYTAFCRCSPGFTPSVSRMRCITCPENTFKLTAGSDKCFYCPTNSYSNQGSLQCTCNPGYHSIISDSHGLKCAQHPSKPRNLKINVTDGGQMLLSWTEPAVTGKGTIEDTQTNLYYKVKCVSCLETDHLVFTPREETNDTSITIDVLESGKVYKLSVTAINFVTLYLNLSQSIVSSEEITFTTADADLRYTIDHILTRKEKERFLVSWGQPSNGAPKHYQIVIEEMYIDQTSPETSQLKPRTPITKITKSPRFHLLYNRSKPFAYRLRVRARTETTWGPFSSYVIINITKEKLTDDTSQQGFPGFNHPDSWNSNRILIMLFFGFGLIIMVVTLVMCLYCKYATPKKHKKMILEKGSGVSIDTTNYSQIDIPLSMAKVYIDPSNYEDPSSILQEFTHEIEPCKIHIERVIGEGEFGEVCKGRLLQSDSRHGIHIAIKTLKSNCSEKEKMNFLLEAGIMGQFNHPNVIKLEGVVTNTEPVMIITHFMENGSLDSFLRKKKNQFSLLQQLGMLRGICSGMRYLSDMHYVHRDLAARNILVDASLCCKVSDFGLSREIVSDTTEGAYTTKGGLIPIRWTAPEAINYRRFTSSSDVWSFGVVMWEMMSYGERPYWNWANKDVLQAIESGYRLPAPRSCPPAVHLLMLDCWTYERSDRPKFSQVLQCINTFIRIPEALTTVRQSRSLNRLCQMNQPRSSLQSCSLKNPYIQAPTMQMTDSLLPSTTAETIFGPDSTISEWLECLGLPNYKENFKSHNLTILAQISRFHTTDLLAVGISQSDHMVRIVNNIRAMQNYFEIITAHSSVL